MPHFLEIVPFGFRKFQSFALATLIEALYQNDVSMGAKWCEACGGGAFQLYAGSGPFLPVWGTAFLYGGPVVLAFAGTTTRAQLLGQVLASEMVGGSDWPGLVNRYYLTAWLQIRAAVLLAIRALPTDHVLIVGHSYGGSLANLAAMDLGRQAGIHVAGCLTFGAPRVSNGAWVRAFPFPHARVMNRGDLVPSLPPRFGYTIPGLSDVARAFWDYEDCGRGVVLEPDGGTKSEIQDADFYQETAGRVIPRFVAGEGFPGNHYLQESRRRLVAGLGLIKHRRAMFGLTLVSDRLNIQGGAGWLMKDYGFDPEQFNYLR